MENDRTNYDDSPAKYIERLKSMMNYIDDDYIADLITQRQTPEEWLEALTKLDFADHVSVTHHRSDLTRDNVGEFVLCTGKDVFTVAARPIVMGLEATPILDFDNLHPGFLALEFFRGSKARPASADEKAPKSSLPPVVLPIGRLFKGYITESGISYLDETDYFLVVDAITPGHPVWLIWDRLAGHEPELDYVHPDERDLVFNGVGKNFDAAQILPSINDWLESYGNLNFNQIEESIKSTGLVGFVKAKEVTVAHVTELLGQAESQLATEKMENDGISDARFAEIKAVVGSPLQGKNFCPTSPSEYIRKLEEATARDNSLDQYLRKACSIDATPPLQSSLKWLQKLANLDFADGDAVGHSYCGLFADDMDDFGLVSNDEATYSVVPNPCVLGPDRPSRISDIDEILLSLKTSALPETGDSLPTLVYTLGHLMKGRKSTTGDSSSETDYVLVVDAVTPGYPVWLVYNRDSWDGEDDEPRIVDPAHRPLIFEGIGHNFDAAQIFPSVHDWVNSYGKVDFTKFEESIKATCITGAVEAKEILSSEVDVLSRQ